MGNTYFISDTHFGHKNILTYEPSRVIEAENLYQDLARIDITTAHDQMLIDNWNKTVKPEDTVWFLGDLAFGNKSYIKEIVSKLNGHKKMIMGNHDRYSVSFYYGIGFEFVLPRKIDGATPHLILKDYFVLSHEPPAYIQPDSVYFYIYGHVHSSECYQTHTEHSQCVCVERQDFKPIRIPEFDNCGSEVEENENTVQ